MRLLDNIKCLTAAVCLCMTAAVSSCVNDDVPENRGLKAGDTLPAFSVTTDAGDIVSSESLQGKAAAIEFFNTSCPDCRRSLPVLQELYSRFADNPDVCVIAIAREESRQDIERYWKEHSFSVPFSPQSDRTVYNLFATTGIPRLFIVSPSGEIVMDFGPDDNPDADSLEAAILSLLTETN